MKSTASKFITLLAFTLVGFSGGYIIGQSPQAPIRLFPSDYVNAETAETFAPFWEVWNLVHDRYYNQPLDDILLTEGAIDGMLAILDDPNTRYLSPEDEAQSRESMEGEIEGIGAEVTDNDGDITIVSPIEGSPAEEAGLQPGDILRTANGTTLTGMNLLEAAQLVRGPKGTTVLLEVERDGERFEIEITRDAVQIASVRGEMLEDNIAYVRLTQFGLRTDQELEEVLAPLMEQNPTGLVLDLRRNPGGSLETAVHIADHFLTDGRILVERFGNGRDSTFESDDDGLAQDIPLVVLIDEGSASASEVLAGAIQDRERGTLIGQTSFGKGTVQTWQPLSNGGGVRITTARWLTPDENWVHDQGLTPDYFIPLPESENPDDFEDTQLQAAIDFLSGETIMSIPPDEQS